MTTPHAAVATLADHLVAARLALVGGDAAPRTALAAALESLTPTLPALVLALTPCPDGVALPSHLDVARTALDGLAATLRDPAADRDPLLQRLEALERAIETSGPATLALRWGWQITGTNGQRCDCCMGPVLEAPRLLATHADLTREVEGVVAAVAAATPPWLVAARGVDLRDGRIVASLTLTWPTARAERYGRTDLRGWLAHADGQGRREYALSVPHPPEAAAAP